MPPPPVLEVGSDFDTSELLKQACQNFAIMDSFEFSTKRSNKSVYTICCKGQRLRVVPLCIRGQGYDNLSHQNIRIEPYMLWYQSRRKFCCYRKEQCK